MSVEYKKTSNFFRKYIEAISQNKNINDSINFLEFIQRKDIEDERQYVEAGEPFFINLLADVARSDFDGVKRGIADFMTEAGELIQFNKDLIDLVEAGEGYTDDQRLSNLAKVADEMLLDIPLYAFAVEIPQILAKPGPLLRMPLEPTGKDLMAPNILTDPKTLNEVHNDQLIQKKATELGNAKFIDVPYLIGSDNIERLFENNKLKAELNNGSANNRDRIKLWNKQKLLYRNNKYGPRKDPIQIKKPFPNYPNDFPVN